MTPHVRRQLTEVAERFGTPTYVYLLDGVIDGASRLRTAFGGRFTLSYAVKANPNHALLERLRGVVDRLDVSSAGEITRVLAAGHAPGTVSFTGPGKRVEELHAAADLGVCVVVESPRECDVLARHVSEPTDVLVRLNPAEQARGAGLPLSGLPSRFGIDEEDARPVLERLAAGGWAPLRGAGFHAFTLTNSLSPDELAHNFSIMTRLFARAAEWTGVPPRRLVFGSGFGIPYRPGQAPLDIDAVAAAIRPSVDALDDHPLLRDAERVLELGRWLVGPHGYFLTRVVSTKRSRGVRFGVCDGGMNHHLAAAGLMGMVIRRDYPIWALVERDAPAERTELVGPLCTSIDVLAKDTALPPVEVGDVIAVGSSGAYGYTASPGLFISHPRPREVLVEGAGEPLIARDVS